MTIVLHAGTHKTGTSTLQRTFDEHRMDLQRRGVYYPDTRQFFNVDSAGHHAFVHAVAEQGRSQEVAAMVADMGRALAAGSDVLLSAEPIYRHTLRLAPGEWWSRHERFLHRLAETLPTSDVKVVLVFRRRDRFVESAYQERVVNGFGKPFMAYLKEAHRLLDYDRQLSQFERAFAVVSSHAYECLAGPRLVDAFLEALSLPPLGRGRSSWERRTTDARITLWMAAAYRDDPDPELVTQRRRFSKNPVSNELFDDYGRVTLWADHTARRQLLDRYGDHEPIADDRPPAILSSDVEDRIDVAFDEYLAAKGLPPTGRRARRHA